MTRPKIGKPPAGLKDDQLQAWYEDQFEDAYEKTLFDHREKVRKAEAALEEAQTKITELEKSVATEDDVLLKGEDAEKWNKLQEIKVDELIAKAEEGEKVVRRAFLREAAEAVGYNPKTFAELVELRGLDVTAEEGENGEKVYQVEVKKDGKAEKVALAEHFQTAFADWLPALAPTEQAAPKPGATTTPSLGRLPTPPRPRPSSDPQRAILEKAKSEAASRKNVVLQSLEPSST